jgi:hypothetical protein
MILFYRVRMLSSLFLLFPILISVKDAFLIDAVTPRPHRTFRKPIQIYLVNSHLSFGFPFGIYHPQPVVRPYEASVVWGI